MFAKIAAFFTLLAMSTRLFGVQPAPLAGEIRFEKTGHKISGEVLEWYQQQKNAAKTVGEAITSVFQVPGSTIFAQCFEKMCIELHPEAARGERIVPMPIGKILYEKYGHGQPFAVLDDPSVCRYFEQSGFYVCLDFLDFYQAHGGTAIFGLPISNFEWQDGKIVQYFENARFEWHANLPEKHRVVVSNLGLEYFHQFGGDLSKLLVAETNAIIDSLQAGGDSDITLKPQAYTKLAVLPLGNAQTLFVLVYNHQLLPVEGAQIAFQVTFPSGQEHNYIIPAPTNAQGFTSFTFPTLYEIGEVHISVEASVGAATGKTTTSFRIWW